MIDTSASLMVLDTTPPREPSATNFVKPKAVKGSVKAAITAAK